MAELLGDVARELDLLNPPQTNRNALSTITSASEAESHASSVPRLDLEAVTSEGAEPDAAAGQEDPSEAGAPSGSAERAEGAAAAEHAQVDLSAAKPSAAEDSGAGAMGGGMSTGTAADENRETLAANNSSSSEDEEGEGEGEEVSFVDGRYLPYHVPVAAEHEEAVEWHHAKFPLLVASEHEVRRPVLYSCTFPCAADTHKTRLSLRSFRSVRQFITYIHFQRRSTRSRSRSCGSSGWRASPQPKSNVY